MKGSINLRRVVVTGMGAITPLGNNVNDFWKNLVNGVSGAAPITKFDASKFKTRFACEVKGFDPLNYMDRKEVRKNDLFTLYAIAAAEEAVKTGGINFENLDRNKIGVIWGSGNGGMQTFQEQVLEFGKGDGAPRFSPFFAPKMLVDIAAGVISIKYGLHGINFGTVSACATSNTAIIESFNYIRLGKANMIITGGSEAPVLEASVGAFNAAMALSTNNDEYQSASRPFDVTRDGFVMGEGGGALILEEYEHAVKRGATIYAEVVGGGMAGDAYHLTGSSPEGDGAYLGMTAALEDADLKPEDIDYLNLHATSTPVGDDSELNAVTRVFGANSKVSLSATKSMTGHLLGAAGAVEAIASIKATQEDIIPPTINTKEVEPAYAGRFDLVLGQAKKKKVNYAMSNTFGFGGHIAITVFKKFEG
jgi:3-oxoacyl-[acyl-carrier-protein] synthase II